MPPTHQFTLREPDGEVVYQFKQGDFVRVHFKNTYSKDDDSVEGFVVKIRGGDPPTVSLDDGTKFYPPSGDVQIDGRRHGSVTDVEVVAE